MTNVRAIVELEYAEALLRKIANGLLREDPVVPQLDSLAKQTRQVIDVLRDRSKRDTLLP